MIFKSIRERLLASSMICGAALMGVSTQAYAQAAAGNEIQELVVTGSRIKTPGLESASPITSIGSEEIRLQQTSEVEQIIRFLPSSVPGDNPARNNGTAGASTIDLPNVVHTSPDGVLSFSLAGFGDGLAQSGNVNAISNSAIRFDLLRAETATILGDVANLRFMETLIGKQATFANSFYRVVHDNAARRLIPGYDMQIYATAPFYLYFQAAKSFRTNAIVIGFGDGFEVNGGGSENSLIDFGPKLLTLTNPALVPPGAVPYSPAGNGPLSEASGLVEVPAAPLGNNPAALQGVDDTAVKAR